MTAPQAPYPPNTKAKGWRFELDYEQIEASGTWSAAASMVMEGLPLARPFLLSMWYAAWKQVPCGSLPADERELAGAIGLPMRFFNEYREVLMRGWWLAADGRLYHPTLTARVLEMMANRRSDADRQALRRERERAKAAAKAAAEGSKPPDPPPDVTRDTAVTHAVVHPKSDTDHRPPNASNPERATASRGGDPPVDNSTGVDSPPPEARALDDPKPESQTPASTADCWDAIAGTGFGGGNRGDPRFAQACANGVTPATWAAVAEDARRQGKSWPWLIAAALGRHGDALHARVQSRRTRGPPEHAQGNGDATRPASHVLAAIAALGPVTPEQAAAAEAARTKVMARLRRNP